MGYSDGVVDGQSSTFQSSFDMGYEQGISFGLKLGYKKAEWVKKYDHLFHNLRRAIDDF